MKIHNIREFAFFHFLTLEEKIVYNKIVNKPQLTKKKN